MEDPNHYHNCDGRSVAAAQRWVSNQKGTGERCPHIKHASDSGHNSSAWGRLPGDEDDKEGTCDKLSGLVSDYILTG